MVVQRLCHCPICRAAMIVPYANGSANANANGNGNGNGNANAYFVRNGNGNANDNNYNADGSINIYADVDEDEDEDEDEDIDEELGEENYRMLQILRSLNTSESRIASIESSLRSMRRT